MPYQQGTEAVPEREMPVDPYGPVGSLSEGGTVFILTATIESAQVDPAILDKCRVVLESRLALRIPEDELRVIRDDSIIVAVPKGPDVEAVSRSLQQTGMLEIIDPLGEFLAPGTQVSTELGSPEGINVSGPIYPVIISGMDVWDAYLSYGNLGVVAAEFELSPDAADRFYSFTSSHIGEPMSIVVDNVVISSPQINAAISSNAQITGITPEEANELVIQLKAGSLPTPLAVVQTANLLPVQVENAAILAQPSTSALIESRLSQGTLVYVTGQPTAGEGGQDWWPIVVLETGATGYMRAADLTGEP
jgi:preprotein translocase subunit SecD